MKKVLVFLLMLSFILPTVSAKSNSSELIELPEQSVIENMTQEELIDLYFSIEEARAQSNTVSKNTRASVSNSEGTAPYTGYIFVTMDSESHGIRHGHAGIGGLNYGDVLESNPGDGVRLYKDKYDYWFNKFQTGGIYKVKNASTSQYKTAAIFAISKIGTGYGLNVFNDETIFCSQLVWDSWNQAGINLTDTFVPATPYALLNSSKLTLYKSFYD